MYPNVHPFGDWTQIQHHHQVILLLFTHRVRPSISQFRTLLMFLWLKGNKSINQFLTSSKKPETRWVPSLFQAHERWSFSYDYDYFSIFHTTLWDCLKTALIVSLSMSHRWDQCFRRVGSADSISGVVCPSIRQRDGWISRRRLHKSMDTPSDEQNRWMDEEGGGGKIDWQNPERPWPTRIFQSMLNSGCVVILECGIGWLKKSVCD